MAGAIWWIDRGSGPLVATAIHDGHEVRPDVLDLMSISEADRLREEDPFTADWTEVAPTRVVGTRSRFEVDLNRPPGMAVYRTPAEAWGLDVWRDGIPDVDLARSIEQYDAFYRALGGLYSDMVDRYGRFVVLDLHTYNHRREGPDGPLADPSLTPKINVGTGNVADRDLWAPVIDRFIADVADFDFPGGRLDVRENVNFRGGHCGHWANTTFQDSVCVLSIEIKKFFMDEWTGIADPALHAAVGRALAAAVPGVLEELERL